ncbi:MAG: ArnT family glycosyltransferase [Lentimicrobium sp.]
MKFKFTSLKSSGYLSDKRIRLVLWLLMALLFLAHLPFLSADPDSLLSLNTRGAWTDEGLYTAQLRDFINHGSFDLYNNNGFIITPVLQIILFPFYTIFGTDIIVGRAVALLFTIGVLFVLSTSNQLRLPALFYLLLVALQFHYFQFCHYSMGEIFAINMILLALFALAKFEEYISHPKKLRWLLLAVFFSFLAWGIKVQFVYVAVLVPAAMLIKAWSVPRKLKNIRKEYYKAFGISVIFTLTLALVYLVAWYLPNQDFYHYIMNYETGERFKNTIPGLLQVFRFNFRHIIWVSELWPLLLITILALIGLTVAKLTNFRNRPIPLALIFGVIWLLVEQHKIAMIYLPTRYFLSLIAAAGIVASLSLGLLVKNRVSSAKIILPVVIILTAWNLTFVYHSWQRRTYDIQAVQTYLDKSSLDAKNPVLGIWSYTLAAESKAPTIGIRHNYLNDKDPILTYKPQLVITEFNQAESDSAWARQGIDLATISDSVRRFKVWRYDLDFYWIKPDSEKPGLKSCEKQ